MPSEILARAAEVIAQRGHHKGELEEHKTGAVCAMGAIRTAAFGGPWNWNRDDLSYQIAALRLAEAIGRPTCEIANWNDDKHTTAEDVILGLKRASQIGG